MFIHAQPISLPIYLLHTICVDWLINYMSRLPWQLCDMYGLHFVALSLRHFASMRLSLHN